MPQMPHELRIVILEDETLDAELVQRQLRKSNLPISEVQVARGRREFNSALKHSPDVILADYALPAFEAWEALAIAQARAPDCPFIIISGALGDETAVGLIKQGADDYLLKDRLTRLPSAIQRALSYRAAEVENRRNQQALRESERRYRQIVNTSLEGIWLVDTHGRITFANEHTMKMLGYSAEDIIGHSFSAFLDHNERSRFLHRIERGRSGLRSQNDLRLRTRQNAELWTMCSMSPTFDDYDRFTGALIMAADITARKEAEDALRDAAFHDSLTGLVKRELFVDRVGQALERAKRRSDCAFAVFFLDVDRFKEINDTLGHGCGDQLLTVIAERLGNSLRSGDSVARLDQEKTVARIGGDEFTALLTDLCGIADATAAARRVQEAVSQPVNLDGRQVTPTVSLGIAVYAAHYQRPDELLRDADTALYCAKAKGKGNFEVWNQQMQDAARRQFDLGQQIHRAPEQNELRLCYQPIVELESGRPVGCEALLRWYHPERGMVSPTEFIPLAEETGAIVPMGMWVLRQACCQILAWDRELASGAPLYVSVNVSPRQLSQSDFPDRVAAVFDETGVPPSRIRFEITESAVVDESDASREVLHQLHELGVKLYMDDFGTGYSTLNHLHELPIDVLKIDRSFTMIIDRSTKQRSIVQTIINLAQNIGIPTIAEGVETEEHVECLLSKGCVYGQGFLFSPPLDSAEIDAWLAERLVEPVARHAPDPAPADSNIPIPPPRNSKTRALRLPTKR